MKLPIIPSHTVDSAVFSLRITYTTLISLLLISYWPWIPLSPLSGYIPPVVAIITAAKYVGHAQETLFHTIYVTVIYGGLGVLISLIVEYPLQHGANGNLLIFCVSFIFQLNYYYRASNWIPDLTISTHVDIFVFYQCEFPQVLLSIIIEFLPY